MTTSLRVLLGACAVSALAAPALAETLTIATVNNGDMIRMQKLADDFTAKNPGITLEWVTLEENVLRQRVTTDIATKGGQYDVVTVGNYEVPIWAKQGWLKPLDALPADYDAADLLKPVADALSLDGKLYAAPFYGESAMVMYRKDLADAAGVSLGEAPTWAQVWDAAAKMTNKDQGIAGICLRGKAGWGENMAFLSAAANSYGAAWFGTDWKPQFDGPEWKEVLTDYVKAITEYGPAGASSNGFNENLALFQQGKCGIWIDATVAASFVTDPKESTVADKVAFAQFPNKEGVDNHGNWLWSWNLAIPASTDAPEAAEKFVAWATSRGYTELVASKEGWRAAPPGTRTSLYANADYKAAAPFAGMTEKAMMSATPQKPSVKDIPYTGGQFVAIPEFQAIGTAVGQQFSAAVAGQSDVAKALTAAQQLATREMTKAGYIK
ncbi:ABC transporter substrate-binding protein [Paracoccus contaminans]|uniref:Sugar ABC transporter substrate-binding protein n=1 Tax=Paracoccus contaminans TaxID=1945662 RepID=A0A1W6D060_9RHOB|nr:sugar ABC transporter substrate-binding protein [Paracoccus contaminans]ARJ70486.1 sugar ABC transporter substrate-binding protein [Paracoccus contaminans]